MGIVVFGAVFVDIKGYPTGQFNQEAKNAGVVLQTHGGVARNVVEDIANVELRPTFVSVVDHSGASKDILDQLKRHKVNTDYVAIDENGLGTWMAVFNRQGEVIASMSQRPNLRPIIDTIEHHGEEIFSKADSVVLDISMESDIVKKILYYAAQYNKKVLGVVSNMSLALERRDLLAKMDCIVCNLAEAGLLFSYDYKDMDENVIAKHLFSNLKKAGFKQLVVTLGDKGSIYMDEQHYGIMPALDTYVIDTTGAGDSFFAGVAIGVTYGKSLEESCMIGTRLASSVIATKENVCPRFTPTEFDLKKSDMMFHH